MYFVFSYDTGKEHLVVSNRTAHMPEALSAFWGFEHREIWGWATPQIKYICIMACNLLCRNIFYLINRVGHIVPGHEWRGERGEVRQ